MLTEGTARAGAGGDRGTAGPRGYSLPLSPSGEASMLTPPPWHFTGEGDELATDAGRPVVVMAHGLAGTKDSGLRPFAEGLAAAGLDVLAFDYRGFGASGGVPISPTPPGGSALATRWVSIRGASARRTTG